jgi:hypothetical protein
LGYELAGETEVLGENMPQCHFVHHTSHMTWSGFEPGSPELWHYLIWTLQNRIVPSFHRFSRNLSPFVLYFKMLSRIMSEFNRSTCYFQFLLHCSLNFVIGWIWSSLTNSSFLILSQRGVATKRISALSVSISCSHSPWFTTIRHCWYSWKVSL